MLFFGAERVHAYIGPGAGFTLLSSFFVFVTTLVLVALSLLAWPFRALVWWAVATRVTGKASARRLIIIGFDGQDPSLTDRFLGEGLLPNFKKLAESGAYRRLRTTLPSLSPVAWSSFSTGCDPGRHNIFDFITPDRRTYMPLLSSARIGQVDRYLRLGRFRVPTRRPEIRLLRKAKPFWAILGEHRIWSTILRVPITFPPDRFYGAQLSAMCVPDLLGTQGTFLLYTTRPVSRRFDEGGNAIEVPARDQLELTIQGPGNTLREGNPPLVAAISLNVDRQARIVTVRTSGAQIDLKPGELSDWIHLNFPAAPGVTVRGITRMVVTELGDHFSMYVAPINLDPESPAMPISHPAFYASYLSKKIGPFATLGLAEDTTALNEGVLDERQFVQQTYDIDREREQMLFTGLGTLRQGSLVCVFDATDRIQHMFWREMEASRDGATGQTDRIRELYCHNDALLGRVMQRIRPDDVLMVLSDHGFTAFKRGVNLNAWLREEGYLVLKPGAVGQAEWLRDVDWTRTRAYCLGLTGLYLNLAGREYQGIVQPGRDAADLKATLMARLRDITDGASTPIRDVFDSAAVYSGPYAANAPDLIIGYNHGYRVSWDCARGIVAGPVCQDNTRAWSGDHCVDPRLVPGVFFCNRPTTTENPALVDIAPTALKIFGIQPPPHMDGRPLEGLA